MAIISFPNTIKSTLTTVTQRSRSGGAIAIGEVVAFNASGKLVPADADVVALSTPVGIALNSTSAADQPVEYAVSGTVDGFSGLKAGSVYCLSNTAGDVCDSYSTDLTEDTSRVSVVAVATSATAIRVGIVVSGVALNLA